MVRCGSNEFRDAVLCISVCSHSKYPSTASLGSIFFVVVDNGNCFHQHVANADHRRVDAEDGSK
jgi:hypothetical protein